MRAWRASIPPSEFAKRLVRRLRENAVTERAAQLAYYFLFALFPFLFFLVTLAAYLPLRGSLDELMQRLQAVLPQQASGIIGQELHDLTTQQRPHFLGFGIALALWSASRGVDALRGALNLSYDVKESRSFFRTNGLALAVTALTSALMLLSIAGLALGGSAGLWLARKVGLGEIWLVAFAWARWPITAVLVMFVVALLYYFLPDVKQEWRFITPGSVIGTGLWILATWAFTLYAGHFGSYQKTYGAIGGVIVLLTWLWLTALVFVIGGEINALHEHHAPDGKEKGARAAGEAPPPPELRPSIAAPGATKSAAAAESTYRRFLSRWRKRPPQRSAAVEDSAAAAPPEDPSHPS